MGPGDSPVQIPSPSQELTLTEGLHRLVSSSEMGVGLGNRILTLLTWALWALWPVGGRAQEHEIHIADLGVLEHPQDCAALFLSHTSPDLIFQLQEWVLHKDPCSFPREGMEAWGRQFYEKSTGFRTRRTQVPIMVLPSLEGQA